MACAGRAIWVGIGLAAGVENSATTGVAALSSDGLALACGETCRIPNNDATEVGGVSMPSASILSASMLCVLMPSVLMPSNGGSSTGFCDNSYSVSMLSAKSSKSDTSVAASCTAISRPVIGSEMCLSASSPVPMADIADIIDASSIVGIACDTSTLSTLSTLGCFV